MRKYSQFIYFAIVFSVLTVGQVCNIQGQTLADFEAYISNSEANHNVQSVISQTHESNTTTFNSRSGTTNGLIGIDFGTSGQNTPLKWNSIIAAGTHASLITEDDVSTGVGLTITASCGVMGFFAAGVDNTTIPINGNPIGNIFENVYSFSTTCSGGEAQFEFKYTNLVPDTEYDIWVFGLRDAIGTTLSQEISIQGSGTPIEFIQTSTADKQLLVNDAIGNNATNLSAYKKTLNSSLSGEIAVTVTANDIGGQPLYAVAGSAISGNFPLLETAAVPLSNWAVYLTILLVACVLFVRFFRQ